MLGETTTKERKFMSAVKILCYCIDLVLQNDENLFNPVKTKRSAPAPNMVDNHYRLIPKPNLNSIPTIVLNVTPDPKPAFPSVGSRHWAPQGAVLPQNLPFSL